MNWALRPFDEVAKISALARVTIGKKPDASYADFQYRSFFGTYQKILRFRVFFNGSFTMKLSDFFVSEARPRFHGNQFAALLMLAVIGSVFGTNTCWSAERLPRVVGGSMASAGEFPWQAAIVADEPSFGYGYGIHCGGSIINERWILTAAHCVDDGAYSVIVGSTSLAATSSAQILAIKQWIPHPDFVAAAADGKILYDNDIALIELESPIDLDACGANCSKIDIATNNNESTIAPLGGAATVSGWGDTYGYSNLGDFPTELQKVSMNRVDCTASPSLIPTNEISSNMMCATASSYTKDACRGDSGGPLVVANNLGTGYIQVGIVSFGYTISGKECGNSGYPGIYTRVSRYASWIWTTTSGACCTNPADIIDSPIDNPDTSDPRDPIAHSAKGGGGALSGLQLLLFSLTLASRKIRRKFRI